MVKQDKIGTNKKNQAWPADHVERRSVESLIPYARNARTHSDAQVAQLAASIQEWGWTTPVLIDETGGIIAGHGRVMAARKLGIENVPVMVATGWSEAQRRAYVLADNQLATNAGWDVDLLKVELGDLGEMGFDLQLIGFDQKEIDAIANNNLVGNIYSDKVASPTYEPSKSKPLVEDLYDDMKAMDLIVSVKESKLSEREKNFLMAAASRHIVFDYSKIADFYAHSSDECQRLMEKSALVIVDFEQAIEDGFVKISKQMDELNEHDEE
jgi:hypothetical protein